MIDFLREYKVYKIEGDVIEIGCFLGGGTYKLCKFYEKYTPNKTIFAVDIFDPTTDLTTCSSGFTMAQVYSDSMKKIGCKSQKEIFNHTTRKCKNLRVIIGDSRKVQLSCEKVSFGFIDGNHSPDYVKNDFNLIWQKLVSGGMIGFDDYNSDLPNVTETIHQIIQKNCMQIRRIHLVGNHIFIMVKA